jgi:hypothetical protein
MSLLLLGTFCALGHRNSRYRSTFSTLSPSGQRRYALGTLIKLFQVKVPEILIGPTDRAVIFFVWCIWVAEWVKKTDGADARENRPVAAAPTGMLLHSGVQFATAGAVFSAALRCLTHSRALLDYLRCTGVLTGFTHPLKPLLRCTWTG